MPLDSTSFSLILHGNNRGFHLLKIYKHHFHELINARLVNIKAQRVNSSAVKPPFVLDQLKIPSDQNILLIETAELDCVDNKTDSR